MDVFKSKIDNWLLICLILSIIACLLGASVMLKIGGAVNYFIAAIILIAGAGFPSWIFASTQYKVGNGDLEIISGPFSWTIPIESIKSVKETQNALTNPALSFDRLEIEYGENKFISVSPDDKKKFMQKLSRAGFVGADKKNTQQTAETAPKKSRKQKNRQV